MRLYLFQLKFDLLQDLFYALFSLIELLQQLFGGLKLLFADMFKRRIFDPRLACERILCRLSAKSGSKKGADLLRQILFHKLQMHLLFFISFRGG